MKITEILEARKAVLSIYTEKLPSKLAYKFTKFLKETNTEEEFYKEKLQGIMKEYGEKDDSGKYIEVNNGIKIKDADKEKCIMAVVELEATEVDVPKTKFTIDEFGDIKLSTEVMVALFAFIEEK